MVVKNVETYVSKKSGDRWKLPAKAETPLKASYRPELDVFPVLKPSEAAYFQSLINIIHWIVNLGIIDICLEVSMMLSHLELQREGHLRQILKVFSYIRKYHNSDLVLYPKDPVMDTALFEHNVLDIK